MTLTKYEEYLNTEAGQRTLSQYSLDDYGVWHVFMTNPDNSGRNIDSRIDILQGKLIDVIRWSVLEPAFWLNDDGYIKKQTSARLIDMDHLVAKEADELERIDPLKQAQKANKIAFLEEKRREIDEELSKLQGK